MRSLKLLEANRDAATELRVTGTTGHTRVGIFNFPSPTDRKNLQVIVSAGIEGWDHVSVSRTDRCPNWPEMCWIKDQFFEAEDCVMQLHPPHSEYINNHPHCLHLWRPLQEKIPKPPAHFVGLPQHNLERNHG